MEYIKTPSDLPKKYKIKFCEKLTSMSMDFLETWLVFRRDLFENVVNQKIHHIWSGVEKETPKKLLSVGIPPESIGEVEIAFAPLIRTSVHSPLKVKWTKTAEVEIAPTTNYTFDSVECTNPSIKSTPLCIYIYYITQIFTCHQLLTN